MLSKRLFAKGRSAGTRLTTVAMAGLLTLAVVPLFAQEEAGDAAEVTYESFMATPEAVMFTINNLWILIAAVLVLSMHLGFSMLESGLCQSKNVTNILFKNSFIVSMGLVTYALTGFNTMYPGEFNGFFALKGPIASSFGEGDAVANVTSAYSEGYTYWSDFIFQAMFAATAATIVSGAVAERIKLPSFMIFVTILVALAYPVSGSWKWGEGWLDDMGFYDFAGSSIVHAFGGFAALACVVLLGARKGKYSKEGKISAIPPHSMPLATIGVFVLFIGWFGFNGGSVLSADPAAVSFVFVTTAMAAAAGCLGSIIVAWAWLKTPDLSMALNGFLAGLVGITAGADTISVGNAIIVGLIAGGLVVVAILVFDRLHVDDPVGAISVHGVCGIWGTVAVGIFSMNPAHSFVTQLIGTLAYSAFAFIFAFIVFFIIKVTIGVRVSEEEEYEGLDIGEHAQEAYIVPAFGSGGSFNFTGQMAPAREGIADQAKPSPGASKPVPATD